MKTNFCRTFTLALCALACSCVSARAQNLLVSVGYPAAYGIDQYTPAGAESTFAAEPAGAGAMTFSAAGDLFFADGNGNIDDIRPGGLQTTFATGFQDIASLAFDASGNLFVGTTLGPGTITKITPAGVKSTFTTGNQTPIELPNSMAFNKSGHLFVANGGNGNILEYTPSGAASFFTSGLSSTGPNALAFNSAGNLFVTSDLVNNPYSEGDIYEYTPSGHQTVFATGLYDPGAIAINSAGDIFVVADANQSGIGGQDTIYEFTPAGVESVFATTGGNGQYIDLALEVPEPSTLGLAAIGASVLLIKALRSRP